MWNEICLGLPRELKVKIWDLTLHRTLQGIDHREVEQAHRYAVSGAALQHLASAQDGLRNALDLVASSPGSPVRVPVLPEDDLQEKWTTGTKAVPCAPTPHVAINNVPLPSRTQTINQLQSVLLVAT
jgi:hypothetical protein